MYIKSQMELLTCRFSNLLPTVIFPHDTEKPMRLKWRF